MQKLQSDCVNLNNYFFLFRRGNIVLPPKRVYMYMPFPYCLLFGDIKKLIIEAVAMPFIRAKIWRTFQLVSTANMTSFSESTNCDGNFIKLIGKTENVRSSQRVIPPKT